VFSQTKHKIEKNIQKKQKKTVKIVTNKPDIRLFFRPDPITVGYWAIQGLAAPLRMMVLYAEVPLLVKAYKVYEDPSSSSTSSSGYNKDSWMKHGKPYLADKFPLVNLPYVKDGDLVVSQTNACLAYLGRRLQLWGQSFSQQVECEEFLCEITDLHNEMFDFAYGVEGDPAECAANLMKSLSERGSLIKLNSHMKLVRDRGATGTFLVGDHATAPDFHLWTILHQ
jgi:glutathione S-transferase